MRALLKEIAIPFEGARQTPRLLLLPLLTGSRLIASFLLRKTARGVKLGWTAAMNLDAPPAKAAPAAREQDDSHPDNDSAGKSAVGAAKGSGRASRAAADDAIERIGLGCLILLFAGVVIAGLVWLFMWLVWPYIAPYAPAAAAVLAVAWVIAAWMIAPPQQETATRNDQEKSAGEKDEESEQDRFTRGLVRFVVAAVHNASPEHMGVHIAELLERLQQEGRNFDGWDQARLREWCTAAGIPVSRNVRAKGKGPTWGVRADELQQAFGTSLEEALKALSRPAPRGPAGGPPATPSRPRTRAPSPASPHPPSRPPSLPRSALLPCPTSRPFPTPPLTRSHDPVPWRRRRHLHPHLPGHLPFISAPSTGCRHPRLRPVDTTSAAAGPRPGGTVTGGEKEPLPVPGYALCPLRSR
ncbi:hypothetical protein [Streptomyces marianii]|uniref:Uncharacterized protein n=1 Tax=Streptomyces marianii TaxID=1817406 RepID=A0A5R9DS18_9ACTN|nr:hypothetical protein [Streptomyces marianii]TLQ39299.1 hypothetical protein FEF34_38555 [Streptomyces marianii]